MDSNSNTTARPSVTTTVHIPSSSTLANKSVSLSCLPFYHPDKATSELLPPGSDETLLTSLQLSDLIRSKAVDSNYALKSLRRRIAHKNPNVQIQSLHVLDVLVKNSGEAFLLTVGNGKEGWMTQLEEMCTSVSWAVVHLQDMERILTRYVLWLS